jgi:hypothetical protein
MGVRSIKKHHRKLLVILAEPVNPYYEITGKTGEPLKEGSEVCHGFASCYSYWVLSFHLDCKEKQGTAATGKPMKNGQRCRMSG